jgi:hypothetical protein
MDPSNIDYLALLEAYRQPEYYAYDAAVQHAVGLITPANSPIPDVAEHVHGRYLQLALRDKASRMVEIGEYLRVNRPEAYEDCKPFETVPREFAPYATVGNRVSIALRTKYPELMPGLNRMLYVPEPLPEIRSDAGGMREFLDSVRYSIATKNWFGALFMALALPDICTAIEFYAVNADSVRRTTVGAEYRAWFNKYLKVKYDADNPYEWLLAVKPDAANALSAEQIVEMRKPDPRMASWKFTADNCYQFRCKALHQGLPQRGDDASSKIHFSPPTGAKFHQTSMGGQWWLAIDIFSEDVCQAVEQWLLDVQTDANIQAGLGKLMTI